ncbi:MAG: VOC family protein [Hyphomicrobiaceae bacterium]
MLTALDHIAIDVADPRAAAAGLEAVLGRKPQPVAPDNGTRHALRLQLGNVAVTLNPAGDAAAAGAGVGLAFATQDIGAAAHRLTRRGLAGRLVSDKAYVVEPSATHGVPIAVVSARAIPAGNSAGDIAGLDHVVVRTPDPERAVALYGGRLGLDLRLDRSNEKFGSRLLFFVCGDLVVEISHDLKQGIGSGSDRLWGMAWRANDVEAAHRRMKASGVTVSELREGRRPGTHVFSVKDHTCGVPTLVIGGAGLVRT